MGTIRKNPSSSRFLVAIKLLFWASMAALNPVKVSASTSFTNGTNIAKPGCPNKCGNVTIPYPFGFGDKSCSLNQNYHVVCNSSFDPPKPFMRGYGDEFLEIITISKTKLRIRNQVAMQCYNSTGDITDDSEETVGYGFLSGSPFSFSHDSNKIKAIGCFTSGFLSASGWNDSTLFSLSCNSECPSEEKVVGGKCEGVGCCQERITKGMTFSVMILMSEISDSVGSTTIGHPLMYNRCGYAFLAEEGTFTFRGLSDFSDKLFRKKIIDHVPVVIDWMIGNQTCAEAQMQHDGSYACKANTTCSNYSVTAIGGYTCSCRPGYQGNPYLSPGCADIDECAGLHNCLHSCHNKPGNYSCSCPPGYDGDGMKNGTNCFKKRSENLVFILKLVLGISLGFLCFVFAAISLYLVKKRLDRNKLKEDRFRNNGGLLLQELLSSPSLGDAGKLKIFTTEELKVATDNFSEDRVLGKGGHGVVYKGLLSKNQVVAVKKSKMVDQSQIEEFVNEMAILGQINHNNVVKIVGCCLESEVPMLVYEYISNGTLFEHIHSSNDEKSWLDWSNCIRIAIEAAGALAHLHSVVSIPIIHRDVKSSNILIDENYTAKIADFGASRLIPLDQTRLTTIVQGTLGYLDPEYYYSGHITEKSDVYSFGVVLIELLTRLKPVSEERDVAEATLSIHFIKSVEGGRILNILAPHIAEEAPIEQLSSMVDLISKCLSSRGEGRPSMMHVLVELKAIRARVSHSFVSQNQNYADIGHNSQPQDETDLYPSDMIRERSRAQDEETDLYPVPFNHKQTTTTNTSGKKGFGTGFFGPMAPVFGRCNSPRC